MRKDIFVKIYIKVLLLLSQPMYPNKDKVCTLLYSSPPSPNKDSLVPLLFPPFPSILLPSLLFMNSHIPLIQTKQKILKIAVITAPQDKYDFGL